MSIECQGNWNVKKIITVKFTGLPQSRTSYGSSFGFFVEFSSLWYDVLLSLLVELKTKIIVFFYNERYFFQEEKELRRVVDKNTKSHSLDISVDEKIVAIILLYPRISQLRVSLSYN
jgi:hypothetical protein